MRAVGLVTTRELRSLAPAAAVAVVASLLPWAAPLLPALAHQPAGEVRQATALAVAALLAGGLALFTGAGMVGRELADGRLGFFLALPLRARDLWLGKLLAACVLVYGATALALLPLAAASPLRAVERPEGGPLGILIAGLLLVAPLLAILAAHQLGVALRARTPWLALELAAAIAATGLAVSAAARLHQSLAAVELTRGLAGQGLASVLVLIGAGWAGLARGGVLPSRVHRAQAIAASGGLVVVSLVFAGWSRWVLTVAPEDVIAVEKVRPAPAGDWLAAAVRLAGRPSYQPWVLLSPRGGWLRLSPDITWLGGGPPVAFAANGMVAVWKRPLADPLRGDSAVVWLDLSGRQPQITTSLLEVSHQARLALSGDGALLAVREAGRVALWGDRGGRLLAVAPLSAAGPWDESLCLAGSELRHVRVVDDGRRWSLEVRRLAAGGADSGSPAVQVLAPGPPPFLQVSPDCNRLAVVRGPRGRGEVTLHDGLTAAEIARLAPPAALRWRTARFLADGRLAVLVPQGNGLVVALHDADGGLLRGLLLGEGSGGTLGHQWRREGLLVTVLRGPTGDPRRELREVDLRNAAVRPIAEPLAPAEWWQPDRAEPGSLASRLFLDEERRLVALDPTGARRQLLPPAK